MVTTTHMVRMLMEQGLTQGQIAKLAGTSQQRISAIRSGGDCHYLLGKQLERVYKEVVINKKTIEEVI